MKPLFRLGVVMTALAGLAVFASAETLGPGQKAPALKVAEWVKGKEVKAFAPGRVYVVAFWTSWRESCIEAMPALSALQTKFKDNVTVIGINGFERPGKDSAAIVKKFVKDQGDKMAFTVARDNADADTVGDWMVASRQYALPTAFLVDQKGVIAWIGSPLMIDEPLAQVIGGTFDIAQSQKDFSDRTGASDKRIELLRRLGDLDTMYREGKREEAMKEFDQIAKDNPGMKPNVDTFKINLLLEDDFAQAEKLVRAQMTADLVGSAVDPVLIQFVQRQPKIKPENQAAYEALINEAIDHLQKRLPVGDYYVRIVLAKSYMNLKAYDNARTMAENALTKYEADPNKDPLYKAEIQTLLRTIKEAGKGA